MENEEIESVPCEHITVDELDNVLAKYFKTQEEIKAEQLESLEKNEVEEKKIADELKAKELEKEKSIGESKELTTQLIEKLDNLNGNTQNINGMIYISVIVGLVLFFSVMFYKYIARFFR